MYDSVGHTGGAERVSPQLHQRNSQNTHSSRVFELIIGENNSTCHGRPQRVNELIIGTRTSNHSMVCWTNPHFKKYRVVQADILKKGSYFLPVDSRPPCWMKGHAHTHKCTESCTDRQTQIHRNAQTQTHTLTQTRTRMHRHTHKHRRGTYLF